MTNLQESFGKSAHAITIINLTLRFHSIGAIVFGVFDRFDRKWALVFNLAMCSVIELGCGFGNAVSYLIAAAAYLDLVPEQSEGRRALF
ncbi:hypothetical protein FIBSPDRAFT_965588 [Athelia psychrophila]|uniref:Major facilitator superfamily (MFS) profile domain-containing protein n=1 Tax=Athelia psychrophila TaxID=1759441 RepID=A0A167XR99_9AGAM|nr:hypothetical protein FIBSPDRAFT_965588 [Fibularhizoctonia sp. CBS 109695]